jgi:hypothetical protein
MQEIIFLPSESILQERRARLFRLCGVLLLVGYLAAACWLLLGQLCNWQYPYTSFLYRANDRFMDFYYLYSAQLKPETYKVFGGKFTSSYWPYHDFLWKMIAPSLSRWPLVIAILAFLSFFTATTYRQCRQPKVGQTLLCCLAGILSYPVIFSIDRGNSELLMYILVYLFVFSYQKKRYNWAVIWLAQAIACKPFPGVFVVLLLLDKRYRDILKCGALFVLLTLVTLVAQVGINGIVPYVQQLQNGLSLYQLNYVILNNGFPFSHSLWAVYKFFVFLTCQVTGTYSALDTIYPLQPYYLPVALLLFACVVWHVMRHETCFWKKITLLVCFMNLLPYASADYKLLYVFIPFFLFLNSRETSRWDTLYGILFSLLLIPSGYFHLALFPPEYGPLRDLPEANSGIVIHAFTMLALSVAIFLERFFPPVAPTDTEARELPTQIN